MIKPLGDGAGGGGCRGGNIPFCLCVDGMLARVTHMNAPTCLTGELPRRAGGGGNCQIHLGSKECVGCTHDSGNAIVVGL